MVSPRALWTTVGPALLVVALALGGAPLVASPDGVEMASAGRCVWAALGAVEACAGQEPTQWPPVFPLVAGGLAFLLDLDHAAILVSLVGTGLLAVALAGLAARGGAVGASWWVPFLMGCVPALRAQAVFGEGRSLALAGVFGAAVWATRAQGSRRAALWMGACVGLAVLTRAEMLAAGGLVLGLAAVRWRAVALWALVPLAATLGPYWAWLSWVAGRPTWSARGAQLAAFGWLDVIPLDWVRMELAAGTWGTPLRQMLSTSGAGAGHPPTLDPEAGLAWFAYALPYAVPVWLGLLGLAGLWVAGRSRAWVPVAALAAVALPAVGVSLLPYQDAVMPSSNLLPLVCALVGLGAMAASWAAARLDGLRRRPVRLGAVAVALGIGGVAAVSAAVAPEAGVRAEPAVHVAAQGWVRQVVAQDERVGAGMATAPLVLRAGRRRARLPSPWSVPAWLAGPERPEWILVSDLDAPGVDRTLSLIVADADVQLVHMEGDAQAWAALLRIAPADASLSPLE